MAISLLWRIKSCRLALPCEISALTYWYLVHSPPALYYPLKHLHFTHIFITFYLQNLSISSNKILYLRDSLRLIYEMFSTLFIKVFRFFVTFCNYL